MAALPSRISSLVDATGALGSETATVGNRVLGVRNAVNRIPDLAGDLVQLAALFGVAQRAAGRKNAKRNTVVAKCNDFVSKKPKVKTSIDRLGVEVDDVVAVVMP